MNIHDAGVTEDGWAFLAMEWLEGATLADEIKQAGPHHFFDGAHRRGQIGDLRLTCDLPFFIGLFVPKEIDLDINRAFVQTQARRPPIDVLHAFGSGLASFFDLAARLPSGELLEQTLMRVGFDVEDKLPAVARDLAHVRRIGVERILHQQQVQFVIAFVQSGAQAFGGIALAIVLFRPIGFQDRLEVKREDFLVSRVDEYGTQAGVEVFGRAIAQLPLTAVLTVDFARGKMLGRDLFSNSRFRRFDWFSNLSVQSQMPVSY